MDQSLKLYRLQDKINFWILSSSLILISLMFLILALSYNQLPPRIPLFYSLNWGESQLVSNGQIIILPLAAILIMLINLVISWHLHSSQIILKRLLTLSSFLITVMTFITMLKIIYLFI